MMKQIVIAATLAMSVGPASAQDLVFSMQATDSCLASGGDIGTCAGVSANICMENTAGGSSTVGMGSCLRAELDMWDARLNTNYQALMTIEKAEDAEMTEIGSSAPKQAPALRDMQRAWITYRDTRCGYVATQWGGGTGAGPAAAACHLQVTAQQTRFLKQAAEN